MFSEFGLPDSYRDLRNLKRRVLKNAMEEINAVTDISIEYMPIKQGRSVTGFKFAVKEKPKPKNIGVGRDPDTIDMFVSMTDAQIKTYSSILSKVHSISNLAGNKDYSAFAVWIGNVLRDPSSVREETAKRVFKALRTETDFKG